MRDSLKPKPKAKSRSAAFWRVKSLEAMTRAEWESLCDGCARCCLNKYEDPDTRQISYTDVACKLLDRDACRCSNYRQRASLVKDCIALTPEMMPEMNCLPPTCAYRLIYEGKDLYDWHPLISGDPESVHRAGISVRGRCVSERGLKEREIAARIVKWPLSKRVRRDAPK
jgi:uncharacterized cysteine cluster protein YcgN (CxxCxxCC family)